MKQSYASKRAQKFMTNPNPGLAYFEEYQRNPYSESNPEGMIISGIAENKILHNMIVKKLSQFKFENEIDLCYSDPIGGIGYRKALLSVLQLTTKRKLNIENIASSTGVTSVLVHLLMAICDVDDGVIVPTPIYGAFSGDIEIVPSCRFVQAKTYSKNNFTATVDDLELAYQKEIEQNKKVTSLLLTNPDNPTGRLISKENLIEYFKWAKKHSLHIIVDEIYALSVFDGEFISSLDIVDEYFEGDFYYKKHLHVINGLSKDFGMSGLRVGYVYSENLDVIRAFGVTAIFSMVSSFTQKAIQFLLEDKKWVAEYLKEMKIKLKEAYEKFSSHLKKNDIPFIEACAGIFVTLDLRKYLKEITFEEEIRLSDHFSKTYKIYINRGQSFFFNEPGYFRIIYSDINELDEILRRITEALKTFK